MLDALNPYPPDYRAAFAFSDLPYPQLHQPSLRLTCPWWAERRAYPVPLTWRRKFRCRLYPGELIALAEQWKNVQTAHGRFFVKPVSIFGLFPVTRFIADSLVFTMLPSLAPCRVMLAASWRPCGLCFTLPGSGYVVRVASDVAVASHACTPRLLPEERQVLSFAHANSFTSLCKTVT